MKKVLVQLDTDPHPSPFDAIVAYDAGIDVLLSHGSVAPDEVRDLVQGAFFTRAPDDLSSMAVWVGGSDVSEGEKVLDAVKADRDYIRRCRALGFCPGVYYPHNIHFLWWAQVFEGRSKDALRTAKEVRAALEAVPVTTRTDASARSF